MVAHAWIMSILIHVIVQTDIQVELVRAMLMNVRQVFVAITAFVTTLWGRSFVSARQGITAELVNVTLTNALPVLVGIMVLAITVQDHTTAIANVDTRVRTVNTRSMSVCQIHVNTVEGVRIMSDLLLVHAIAAIQVRNVKAMLMSARPVYVDGMVYVTTL